MQVFLPYESYLLSAQCLDWRRLGKQRVECMQIINTIEGKPRKDGKPSTGWRNHPATIMWRPYLGSLKYYANIVMMEWLSRGYENNMDFYKAYDLTHRKPHWLGYEPFHASHRSNLLKKDKEYYSAYGWEESDDSPYLWNDVDGKWYKQEAGSKEKIYFYGDLKSHIRTKPLKSYYIKEKGGDPRNHSWKEVGESEYEKAKKSEFFKKIETETRS
tara:strand:+ start:171 stop:815 length:645 start_codon:yes stop_codon:yes gene_type:complete